VYLAPLIYITPPKWAATAMRHHLPTCRIITLTTGSYLVIVRASAANNAVTVACGNLAPPTL
jgi:methionyl-tRNA formyltransferase